ncbi:hypothetical protein [Synechococcus phage S-B68]|nr:hypothetical protein [Synechococcus phage S-B68]
MSALKPIGTIVAVDCSAVDLSTDPRTLNEFNLYNATKVRVTNLSNAAIAVMRCEAQGNDSATGSADFINVDAGFGEGALVLPAGETVIISKKAGGREWDDQASEWVVNPPSNYWGEVVRLDDVNLLGNTGAPTSGFIYASAVATEY